MLRTKFKESVDNMVKCIPTFKAAIKRLKNGGQKTIYREMSPDEVVKHATIGTTSEKFIAGLQRLEDVSFHDKFDTIDMLNAQIAQIQFAVPTETETTESVKTEKNE